MSTALSMEATSTEPGKRQEVPVNSVSGTYKISSTYNPKQNQTFSITATSSNRTINFLIDSGADASVLPSQYFEASDKTEFTRSLISANNSIIEYFGEKTLSFNIRGFKTIFRWSFAVANISRPILGADFLSFYDLQVNCKSKIITSADLSESSHGHNTSSVFQNISQYKETNNNPNIHEVQLSITTEGPPISQRSRKLFGDRLQATKEEFNKLLKNNVIRASKSSWASPLVLVKKSDGSWRPCGDYRLLNSVTKPDKYPLPRIQDILDGLTGSRFFSKLDMTKAYHQIPIAEEDCHKTAVITPFGLFEYTHMPFGLRNSAQTFQRFIDNVLRDVQAFCVAYVDDILIFSKSAEEHDDHIQTVTSKINLAGLKVNIEKCEFRKEKIQFLGFELQESGIKASDERIEHITKTSQPMNIRMLRRYIGAIGYYHWLIPNLSQILAPQHELEALVNSKKNKFSWEFKHEIAFQQAKLDLTKTVPAMYPDPKKKFTLCTDASATSVEQVSTK